MKPAILTVVCHCADIESRVEAGLNGGVMASTWIEKLKEHAEAAWGPRKKRALCYLANLSLQQWLPNK